VCEALAELAAAHPHAQFVYPVHFNPHVRATVDDLLRGRAAVQLVEPVDYLTMAWLLRRATLCVTDSGGLQEESAALGTPTLILRFETEWEYLVKSGAHKLVGNTPDSILDGAERWLSARGLAEIRATPAPTSPGAALRAVDAMLTPL
jgi:UDP-N-acetylglucosamine 2-epimerase (non-hydrolysing)